jgi:tRNA pseudouridine13 synthase
MKIKQQPEDFQVEEVTSMPAGTSGPFAFYRLEKSGWTTPDALQVIRRRWQVDHRRMSYGGLKDRHARTTQYLTIYRGPQRHLTHQRLKLTYLGQLPAPYTSADIQANRLRLTLRAMTEPQITAAVDALEQVRADGVPNYFDDQRFGSVSGSDDFMARFLVQGRYEDALRAALASPYEYDRASQKKEKEILRAHWGDWTRCKDLLPRSHARSLVDYLVHHPADFRGAVERLRPELRGLYLSAYQSYLWNRMLARWLREHIPGDRLVQVRLRLGDVPMHRAVEEPVRAELAGLTLPLPSARLTLDPADPRQMLLEAILQEEGLRQEQFKLKGLREMFFSKGERAALCLPRGLEYAAAADENHPGKEKLTLAFELSRGSYATLMVKRIMART